MIGKVLAVFGFVAVAYAADLTVGVEGGRLIFEQNITASPAIWRQEQFVTVNATNTTDELISRVVVVDNRPGKDGEATVVEGGEGQKNVTLELKSPAVFRGFDFSIQVFATESNAYGRGETQNPQLPKDLNVNSNQKPKDGGDIIIGAPAPTASSTTEVNKDDQQKINPALVGKDQPRQNRDTEEQMTNYQASVPTPVVVDATKDTKVNENATKTDLPEMDGSLKKTLDSIFENNSTQKAEEEDTQKVVPVMPQAESDDLINLRDDENDRKVRQAYKEPVVPALHKELSQYDDQTTPKIVLSSTTLKVGQEKTVPTVASTTEKNTGQEKPVPSIAPVTEEVSSTTQANKLTTEIKLPENVKTTQDFERNVKDHSEQHYGVPMPYVN